MSNPTRQFGRIPYEIVDRGALIHLGATELRVYCALLIGADAKGSTCPSLATLARRAGCSTRTVSRVVAKLASKGFITLAKGGGRGRSSTYTINENHDTLGVTLLPPKTTTPKVSRFTDKPRHLDTKTTTSSDLNHDKIELNHDTLDVSLTEEQNEQTEQSPASPAAAVVVDDRKAQATEALARAGVGEPSRARLASRAGVTAELVRSVVAGLGDGAGPGLIVVQLNAEIDKREQADRDAAEAKQRKHDAAQVRADALAALEREHEQDAEAHRAEVDAWWDGLGDADRARWGQSGIPSPHPSRDRMGGEDVGTCRGAGRSLPLRYLAWKQWHMLVGWRIEAAAGSDA